MPDLEDAVIEAIKRDGVLTGKVAVVTGASRGIGEAIAIRFAQEGAKVIVSARTIEDGDHFLPGSINSVVQRIRDAGARQQRSARTWQRATSGKTSSLKLNGFTGRWTSS
ncbi:MAG: SDR family NAD(P)-dependent oxidoreductase [Dehalococcoidia bacterium]